MVNGLGNLDIHNDAACHKIKDEITLMPLFCAINALTTKELRDEAYDNVKSKCRLTDKANKYFDYAKDRYTNDKSSIFVLAKILKYHSIDYYKKYIKDLVKNVDNVVMHNIDLNSEFKLNDVRNKAKRGEYIYASEIAEDLSKLMRMLDNTTDSWLMKVYDVNSETNKLEFWKEENVMKKLSQIVWKTELSVRGKKKEITAKHVIIQYLHKFAKKLISIDLLSK